MEFAKIWAWTVYKNTTIFKPFQGIFPRSYVKVKPSFVERHGNQKIITPKEDCVAEEAKLFLR